LELKDKILNQIRTSILEILPGSEIILFGSRARNDADDSSDYDLLIILNSSLYSAERLKFQALIRKKLAVQNILADIIVQSRSEVELKKNFPGHIVRSALKEGVSV
jgi:predicted nucleotidyltransferase